MNDGTGGMSAVATVQDDVVNLKQPLGEISPAVELEDLHDRWQQAHSDRVKIRTQRIEDVDSILP